MKGEHLKNRIIWEGKSVRFVGVWDDAHEIEEVVLEVFNGTDRMGATRWRDCEVLSRTVVRELAEALAGAPRVTQSLLNEEAEGPHPAETTEALLPAPPRIGRQIPAKRKAGTWPGIT